MPKGYWIPHIDVRDPEGYKAYTAATPAAHEKYRGVALVRGGRYEVVEGRGRARNVLREFPDYAAALACYRSEEYQRARPLRLQNAECDFIIAEGYEGAQPPSSSAAPPATARKGYWIGHIDVFDPEGYKPYLAANQMCFANFGARYLVRGGATEVPEGKARAHRGDRISKLRGGAGLLPVRRVPGGQEAARGQGADRPRDRRGLRRRKVLVRSLSTLPLHRRPAIPAARRKPMAEMRVIVAGAGGRMGRTLIHAVAASKDLTLAGAVEAAGAAVIGRDAGELAGLGPNGIKVVSDVAPLLKGADGLIEFTIPAATLAFAELTAAAGLVHVIGTTGHSAEEEKVIAEAGKRARIVKSGNMSLGVNLLAALVKRVAKTLDEAYDIEILEMHHNKKIDAPSGTALMLGRAAAAGRGIDLAQHSARGRDGMTGARCAGDIGFASLRGGTVVGDHTVTFAGPAERLELTHRAEDRMIFARGALHAALWARGQKPGLYSMADVLGLSDV